MHITKSEYSPYIFGKTLGQGTFGKVKLGTHRVTGEPVAIKILEKAKIKDVTDVQRVSRQLHILKITQHSSIAQMYEILETEQTIFIVMQYASLGEFFDYIMDGKIKTQQEAHHYFVQIVLGLEYLHKLKISHRDIKPQNMLLDHNARLKIVDFGLSNMYKQGQLLLTACGSPCYASPQMIKGQKYDPELTDVWSLGVVLFSMIFAKLPFEDDNTSILYGKIKSGLYVIDKKISPELRDLLGKLLCVKPKNRYNVKEIKQHPWYKRQKMCKCNGIVVGFENILLDQRILQQMELLHYDSNLTKKYLQNNIRNQMTTAYYLLMKKKLKNGQPSPYDICNQNFNKKVLVPKMSRINKGMSDRKVRHQSVDIMTPTNKETIQIEDSFEQGRKGNRISGGNQHMRKQRNCYSQMKSDEYNSMKSKITTLYKTNQPTVFKKIFNDKYCNRLKTKQFKQRDSFTQARKLQDPQKYLLQKRKPCYKNTQKQHNISINVYINNAKIQTPTKTKKSSNIKLEKQLLQSKNSSLQNNFILSNKRIKTQMLERQKMQNKKYKKYQNKNKYQSDQKGLEKSKEILLLENTFWKKKSNNGGGTRGRQYTTNSKKDRQIRLSKW